MPDHILYHIFYVIISAFSEFLPVSARAHQMLYEELTGSTMADPVMALMIHLGELIALCLSCRSLLRRLSVGKRMEKRSKGRQREIDRSSIMDGRVLRTMCIPLILGSVLCVFGSRWVTGLHLLAVASVLGGALLFVPQLFSRGNKDGRMLSRLDSVCIGLAGVLAVIPGFSRVGGMLSVGTIRGGRMDYLADIILVASIPVIILFCALDMVAIFGIQFVLTLQSLLWYLFLGAVSFLFAYLGTMLLRFISVKTDTVTFSFYSWGIAAVSFVLYLLI